MTLSPELSRASESLRAAGKELSAVLSELRAVCGPAVRRAPPGREATIYLTMSHEATVVLPDAAVLRLADAVGLQRVQVLPWHSGLQVCYLQEAPPPLDRLLASADVPPSIGAHAHALGEALRGHHERAADLFGRLCEQQLGARVTRPPRELLPSYASRPAPPPSGGARTPPPRHSQSAGVYGGARVTAGGYSPRRGVLCSPSEAPTGAAPVSYPRVPRLKQLAAAAADLISRSQL